MGTLDAAIVVGSLVGLVALGGWLAARQKVSEDYYLGGRRLPAWALGASLAANQVRAISLVGAPAFVALRAGGGLVWLQYELAVPLAMIVLVGWGVPFLRRAGGARVYSAVEARFGRAPRRALAVLFMVSRGAGAGVILYASALVVAAVTGWSLSASLPVVGGVAVACTSLGGLVADVVTDVAQLGLLWGGTALAGVAAGVAVNLVLAIWVTSLSWLWWNVTGLAATVGVGVAAGRVSSASALAARHEVGWHPHASWLGGLFAVILALLAAITLAE